MQKTKLFFLLFLLAAPAALAQEKPAAAKTELNEAEQRIENFTRSLLASGKKLLKDEAGFQREVDRLLTDMTEFGRFAKNVMGRYADDKAMRGLSRKQRRVLRGQIKKFTGVFRKSLVRTFSNTLLIAVPNGARAEIVPDKKADTRGNKAVVHQKIHGLTDNAIDVFYKMEKSSGRWLVRNISLAGVNLGQLYRSQFEDFAAEYGGDINRVIANWNGIPENAAGDGKKP